MKKISASQLAVSYVGVFLGAGFVSGQELWQFFACFGSIGLLGFLGTASIFFYIFYSCFRLIRATDQTGAGKLLTCGNIPWLQAAVDMMLAFFNFGVAVIMTAGASTLIQQLTGLPVIVAGIIFTIAVLLVALVGLQGLVATFSILVPVTTACAVLLGLIVLVQSGFQFAPATGSVSPMVPNWWAGFITYGAYNIFGTISILIPFSRVLPDDKALRRGLGGGSVILIALAWSIIAALVAAPAAGANELPMSSLAAGLHPALEVCYGILMGLGMFSCALSCSVGICGQVELRWKKLDQYRKPFIVVIYASAFFLSLLGFGNLIGVIYPFFGYASIPLLISLVINWQRVKKAGKIAEESSAEGLSS